MYQTHQKRWYNIFLTYKRFAEKRANDFSGQALSYQASKHVGCN